MNLNRNTQHYLYGYWLAAANVLASGNGLALAVWHEQADYVVLSFMYLSLKCFPVPQTCSGEWHPPCLNPTVKRAAGHAKKDHEVRS